MSITLGQVVVSKAGRDAGKKFIVVEVIGDHYALIADGDLRRVEKPKKKKIKHLELTGELIEPISGKLNDKLKVTNSEIRKSLAALESNQEKTDME